MQGGSSWVHVPDDDDAKRAVRALADHSRWAEAGSNQRGEGLHDHNT